MKKKVLSILLTTLLLASCELDPKEEYKAVYHQPFGFFTSATKIVDGKEVIQDEYVSPLNTSVLLTMYKQEHLDMVVEDFDSEIIRLHKIFDRYHDYSDITNLKTINDSYGLDKEVKVSDELFDLIKMGIELTKLSKGKFNIAMGALIDVYGNDYNGKEKKFENPNTYNTLPDINEINDALTTIPSYTDIDKIVEINEENKTIKFNKLDNAKANVVLSLGAISKGYVVDLLVKNIFAKYDYPAIINAGNSTISLLNNNPMKDYWLLALSAPNIFDEPEDYLAMYSIKGSYNMSTSADNQQNFLVKDENEETHVYHHILDSNTGVSNSYHRSVSITSKNASNAILDACSTAVYNMETYDEIEQFLSNVSSYYNCNLDYLIANMNDNLDEYDVTYSINSKSLISYFGIMVKNKTER